MFNLTKINNRNHKKNFNSFQELEDYVKNMNEKEIFGVYNYAYKDNNSSNIWVYTSTKEPKPADIHAYNQRVTMLQDNRNN
jgi:hypothetical protein